MLDVFRTVVRPFLRFLMASLHSSLNHGFPGGFGFVGCDHFHIILEWLHSTVGDSPTRYNFDKAHWPRFEQTRRENLQTEMIRNSTDPILKLNETVILIADETIPKTSTKLRQEARRFCLNVLRAFALKMRKLPRMSDVGCFSNRSSDFLRFLMASLHSSLNHGF
jgi:hypothetical protein